MSGFSLDGKGEGISIKLEVDIMAIKINEGENQMVLNELNKLYVKEGSLTPDLVVREAESMMSPLHNYFEWDDEIAAHKHRLQEARQLIRSVKVTIEGREVQAFWNVKIQIEDDGVQQAYHSIHTVVGNKEMYEYTVEEALRELEYWKEKYHDIQEMYKLVNVEALAKAKENING